MTSSPSILKALCLGAALTVGLAAQQPSASGDQRREPPAPTLLPLVVTQLDDRQVEDELGGRSTFSIRFAEPLPVKELLLFLLRGTRFSIVPDPDVEGAFIGELKDVTLRQALDLILPPLGLDYSVQSASIHVFRRRLETRLFDVNQVFTKRTSRRTVRASLPATGGGESEDVSEITSVDESDLFAELTVGIQTLLSPQGKFNLDRKAALLQVTDFPDPLNRVSLYLETVQNRLSRQVQIRATVIEVELREPFTAGIDWVQLQRDGRDGVLVSQTAAPAPGTALKVQNVDALIQAFERQGRVNVLASPRVLAMNNEPAMMKVGTQDVFFLTSSETDAVTGRIKSTVSPHAMTEGIVLSVTAQISPDGAINLSVSPRITERTATRSRGRNIPPAVTVRETDTRVRVFEGETVVIAGLLQDRVVRETSRVPVLGAIPGLGGLFHRSKEVTRKTDLVVLLTPTLLTPAEVAATRAREPGTVFRTVRP